MFKKIYVEITNNCNLNCPFCIGNDRQKEFISEYKFNLLLNKLKGHTKYLYFHLMGEPLIHPEINKLIDTASKDYKINITTNGYFINRIKDNKNIHQVNISLHSYDDKKNKTLDEYLNDIYNAVDNLLVNNTIINYRLWVNNKYKDEIIKSIENRYNTIINGNTKIKDYLYLEFETEFIWPNINNHYCNEEGSCQGLRTHIGILVDGSVVPCCLDYNGNLKLGNIYEQDLDEILNQQRVKDMIKGFQNNKKIEKLCQHCNFYDRIMQKRGSDNNVK